MENKVIISKIKIDDKYRIGLTFDSKQTEKNVTGKLRNIKYCGFKNMWYIAYDKEEYSTLKQLGYEILVNKNTTTSLQNRIKNEQVHKNMGVIETVVRENYKDIIAPSRNSTPAIKIEFHTKRFFIRTNYNPERISVIKSLTGAWWNKKYKNWVAKATIENLNTLQKSFQYWDVNRFNQLYKMIALIDDPLVLELYRTPDNIKRIWVKVRGFRIDLEFMKQIDERHYDKQFNRWSIPNEKKIVERIIEHYRSIGAKIVNRLPKKSKSFYFNTEKSHEEKQRALIKKFGTINKTLVEKCSNVMIAQRYSWRTINSYIAELVGFANYVRLHKLTGVDSNDVNKYITQRALQKISDSKINLIVSALKFYYTKVVFKPDFNIEKIKRPRKGLRLPNVLSKQEIEMILIALENTKHVTILYTLYSSGLRLSELLNLRVEDISFDRKQIFVRAGKGKKDRVVMLSETLKELLIFYTEKYKPVYWLFEGQDKMHKYSASSVQKIVRAATKKAGINKHVTPHKIRHCFATHLLDGGTDIRFIQELLGHKDIKTTLIYTHVTTKNMTEIKSPLDDLKLKIKK